jgi:hypothetical protein
MRNNSSPSRKQRIKDISKQIAELTSELSELLQLDSSDDSTDLERNFEIGDAVVINNSYRGLKGATGTIEAVTKKQVDIRLLDNRVVRRHKSNVSKISRQ